MSEEGTKEELSQLDDVSIGASLEPTTIDEAGSENVEGTETTPTVVGVSAETTEVPVEDKGLHLSSDAAEAPVTILATTTTVAGDDTEVDADLEAGTGEGVKEGSQETPKQVTPLDAVGKWFQNLTSPKPAAEQTKDSTAPPAMEMESVDQTSPNETGTDDQTEQSMPDISTPKATGAAWGVGAFFRKNKKEDQPDSSDILVATTVVADKGMCDDDENLKKKGGVRQQTGAFFRTKYGQLLLITCAALLVLFLVVVPLLGALGKFFTKSTKIETSLQASMMKNPRYNGDLKPEGKVSLRFDEDERFLISFRVFGIEEKCDTCQWAILDGDSCQDPNALGNDYFEKGSTKDQDPFGDAVYSSIGGMTETVKMFYNGYNLEQNQNRVIIMKNSNYEQVACGVLKKVGNPMTFPKLWANMMALPDYGTEVNAHVFVDFFLDNTFYMGISGTGLPAGCPMCNILVHSGVSCKANFGESFYNREKLNFDTWGPVNGIFYATDLSGAVVGREGFYVYDGFGYTDHLNHVVIMQDQNGKAVACGELRDSSSGGDTYNWKQTEASMVTGESIVGTESTIAEMADQIGSQAIHIVEEVVGIDSKPPM